ncbi:hypothetical protein OSCT_1059 [Oscillochloris trichoides DG-6]|uniref:Uncharacterized protein n=1 Tax=Oscillochloris trichoides DG-6 TaxID=765420 RepID=E1ICK8_9CHLR|nr:hypothetical protein OSCT_1059 [Oscillochloris trichoides DG-6]
MQLESDLHCALTGRRLRPDEAYWAPPLITTSELISTIWRTLLTNPNNLSHILMDEPTNVPYAPEARQELARRRSTEQAKLLGVLLLVAALVIIPIVMLMM